MPYDPETGLSETRERYCVFRAQVPPLSQGNAYKAAGYNWHYKSGKKMGEPWPDAHIRAQAYHIESKYVEEGGVRRYFIKDRIEQIRKESAEKAMVDTNSTIILLDQRNRADATELSGVRYLCCRYCWGENNDYQRTVREMKEARRAFERDLNEILKEAKGATKKSVEAIDERLAELGEFDTKGGIGWNPTREINPECCECHGLGVMVPYIADTSTLSAEARSIYAGIEIKKDGSIRIHHNREGASAMLPKIQGLLKDQLELSGKVNVADLSPEQREAEIRSIIDAIAGNASES